MRRVGEVVRTAQGLAIVRCPDEDHPAVGTDLVDEELAVVGTVVEVFGPVDRPFLAVTPPNGEAAASRLGRRVFAR